jgi:GT2 family glycosyltransferase
MNLIFSNPYSQKKLIGEAYNNFCRKVENEEDWIILQDGDIMYLTPNWGRLIYSSIRLGSDFALIGCYTNRLRLAHQLHEGKFSDDHDIMYHARIAETYAIREPGVTDTGGQIVAGLFMAFQKKTWRKVGGFNESSIAFDADFSLKVLASGGKIGLMNNLYVYHWYRGWNTQDPCTDTRHLV